MPRYIAHHRMLKNEQETRAWWAQAVPVIEAANRAGQFPARLLYTWIPVDLTAHPVAWCLWEGESPEVVRATLEQGGILAYMTAEIIEVSENDWFA